MKICCISECSKKSFSRGLCQAHYQYYRSKGQLSNYSKRKTALEWIKDHVNTANNDCIIWPFARTKAGYPNMFYNGAYAVASRVMCIIAHGEPPEITYHAAHNCGNGKLGCMNPNHLEWKTATDNESDKLKHGTRYRGDDCSFAKLTWDIVNAIREDAKTMRNCDIAKKYEIDPRHTHAIIKRKIWNHDPVELS